MANPTSSWSVISQRPTTGQNAHGNYVGGQEVRIKTGMGHEGVAFIPYDQLDGPNGKRILASLALRLDTVGSLSDKTP